MVNMKKIYIAQTNFVNEIAKDIVKHGATKEICMYADKFATYIDSPYGTSGGEGDGFIRVQFGEAYAYVDVEYVDDETDEIKPTGEIWFNNDEMGCDGTTYEEIIDELNKVNNYELYEAGEYTWCYDENDGTEDDYVKKLTYVPYGN